MSLKDQCLRSSFILFEAKTASGKGEKIQWPGGAGSYHAFGTFDTGDTVKLQISGDGGTTWTDLTGASWSAASVGEFAAGNCWVRAVTAITGTSSINFVLMPSLKG